MSRKFACAVLCLGLPLAGQFASAQQPQPGQKAGDFFKNVQILKDLPANLMQPTRARARQMLQMVNSINETTFGGRQVVTCYSCHRGATKPVVVLPHGGGEEMPGGIANPA